MNIFISWSGETSKEIAEELKNWLPLVIQSAKPFYTPSDIEPGQRWDGVINKKLSECAIGLICLTKNNTEKPWILFEAGALSTSLDKSRVCPILFGVKKSEVTEPLAGIQLTEFTRQSFFQLLQTINKSSEGSFIEEIVLKKSFDAFFPQLEERINEILANQATTTTTTTKPERTERNILEEILDLVRKQNQVGSNISSFVPPTPSGNGVIGLVYKILNGKLEIRFMIPLMAWVK
ncbi:toll/interleukin-1 receptor domain-containing protein [Chryseobacterium wanjuense]